MLLITEIIMINNNNDLLLKLKPFKDIIARTHAKIYKEIDHLKIE